MINSRLLVLSQLQTFSIDAIPEMTKHYLIVEMDLSYLMQTVLATAIITAIQSVFN